MIKNNHYMYYYNQLNKHVEILETFLRISKGIDALRLRNDIVVTKQNYEDEFSESSIISSSAKLNKNLIRLLDYAKKDDYFAVENTIKNIEIESTKIFFHSENILTEIKKILIQIQDANSHFTVSDWRFERIVKLYTDLRLVIDKTKQKGTLKEILNNSFFEIQNSFNYAFSDFDSLCEFRIQVDQIFNFDNRIKNELPQNYKLYVTAKKKLAKVVPLFTRLQPIEKDGKIIYHKEGINKISEEFGEFLSSYSEFIASIEDTSDKDTKIKSDKNTCKDNHVMSDKK